MRYLSYQHHCEVDRYNCLKEEWFEVIGGVGDEYEEDSGNIDSENGSKEPSAKDHSDFNRAFDRLVHARLPYEVLC